MNVPMCGTQHQGMQGLCYTFYIITRPVAHLMALFEVKLLMACTSRGDPGGDTPFNSHSNKAVKLSAPLLVGDPGASSLMPSQEMIFCAVSDMNG